MVNRILSNDLRQHKETFCLLCSYLSKENFLFTLQMLKLNKLLLDYCDKSLRIPTNTVQFFKVKIRHKTIQIIMNVIIHSKKKKVKSNPLKTSTRRPQMMVFAACLSSWSLSTERRLRSLQLKLKYLNGSFEIPWYKTFRIIFFCSGKNLENLICKLQCFINVEHIYIFMDYLFKDSFHKTTWIKTSSKTSTKACHTHS